MQQSVFAVSEILIESIGIYRDTDRKEQLQKNLKLKQMNLLRRVLYFLID